MVQVWVRCVGLQGDNKRHCCGLTRALFVLLGWFFCLWVLLWHTGVGDRVLAVTANACVYIGRLSRHAEVENREERF